jgi:hypothetical protein
VERHVTDAGVELEAIWLAHQGQGANVEEGGAA